MSNMFTIMSDLITEFNRDLDRNKLVFFEKKANLINSDKLHEYSNEIHHIMQRHYYDEEIINECKRILVIFDNIKLNRKQLNKYDYL